MPVLVAAKSCASAKVVPCGVKVNITLVMLPTRSPRAHSEEQPITSSASPMKAALRSVWKENQFRLTRYPLLFGAVLVVLASLLGFLPDSKGEAITGLLSGSR